jgi:hypothetical protein
MFLHIFDILKRNLNGLFQKFKPVVKKLCVVTKLCAVTKLGDLTVSCFTRKKFINFNKFIVKYE